MFNTNTVFVIGAGASEEVNLPVGSELKQKISSALDLHVDLGRQSKGDRLVFETLRWYLRENGQTDNFKEYLRAARHISSAMTNAISIDNFVDAHAHDQRIEVCGKIGIAKEILEAERNSNLRYIRDQDSIDFKIASKSWYPFFFQMLHEGRSLKDVKNLFQNVSFIIFNYDRCLEHYLFHAIRNYYGLNSSETADVFQGVEFIHPYGQVGVLPELGTGKETQIKFGAAVQAHVLSGVSQRIMTFSEHHKDAQQLETVKKVLKRTEQIVFLGFAYHQQNLELLNSSWNYGRPRIYGSALNISSNDTDVIRTELINIFCNDGSPVQPSVVLDNGCTAKEMLTTYWRSLMA